MKSVIALNFFLFFVLFSASQADEPQCGPVCLIYCKYGNVLDERGCPLCFCKPKPYPPYCGPVCRIGCRYGLQTDYWGCPICRCRRRPCPQYRCYRHCPYGYRVNRYGCSTCLCRSVVDKLHFRGTGY